MVSDRESGGRQGGVNGGSAGSKAGVKAGSGGWMNVIAWRLT